MMLPTWIRFLGAALLPVIWSVELNAHPTVVEPPPTLSTEEVVQRLMARSNQLSNRLAGVRYSFRRETLMEELDSSGKSRSQKSKEHRVEVNGLEQTSTLSLVNGKPLEEQERGREQHREDENREKFTARGDRSFRIGHHLDAELLERFQYRLLGAEQIEGRWTYLLAFDSQREEPGGKIADRILAGLGGRLWVDATDFEPVRLEASLRKPVSIGLFLAVLDEFRTVVVRRRLPSGLWVEDRLSINVGGRKLIQRFNGRMEVHQDEFSLPDPVSAPVSLLEQTFQTRF